LKQLRLFVTVFERDPGGREVEGKGFAEKVEVSCETVQALRIEKVDEDLAFGQ
jgi:hypothetical protein